MGKPCRLCGRLKVIVGLAPAVLKKPKIKILLAAIQHSCRCRLYVWKVDMLLVATDVRCETIFQTALTFKELTYFLLEFIFLFFYLFQIKTFHQQQELLINFY